MDYDTSHHIIMIILICSNLTQPGSSGSFDQVEAPAPHACGPTDEPLAAVAAIATSLPDEAWFVHTVSVYDI